MHLRYTGIAVLVCLLALSPGAGGHAAAHSGLSYRKAVVRAGSRSYVCHVVTVNLASGRWKPRVVTAWNGVGQTEAFESMLKRSHAVAAINGSFFDAYNQVGDKDPGMTLIHEGQVIHKGGAGTVIGFHPGGVVMGHLDLPIRGTVSGPRGRPLPWYAYWINRTPTTADSIVLFTPAHGARTRVGGGLAVVVIAGVVADVLEGDVAIPANGYVIYFRGGLRRQAAAFTRGAEVRVTILRKAAQDTEAWQAVTEAVGAGPRLLTDGHITLRPEQEGFEDPKILSYHGQRSAIGITRAGSLLLVTVHGPTIAELAEILRGLGAVQAMNLDGGASSGLYCNGVMITRPGRLLSNALVFVSS
jgi:hypothetical protein